jgi:diacylglycerol kinase family enzyme
VEEGANIVVAMGGDGMVHHVAQGLIGSDAALGIIPAGTTNVAARLFGIPSRHTRATRLIAHDPDPSQVGTVRLTLVRGETETVHNAIFACGVGLDAEVVRVADQDPYRKYRFGSVHYARSALGVGIKSYPSIRPHVTFNAGDKASIGVTALVQFREVYTYFGKIAVRFDEERPDPMSILIMERLKRRRIPRILFGALSHRDLGDISELEVWPQVENLSFQADPPVAAQADGESLGIADAGSVEWMPDSLRVIAGAYLLR